MDKASVLANFGALNTKAVSLDEARRALDNGEERVRGLVVGQSTGTSGNRGVFLISEAERFTWLGVILAKALPDFPWVRHKVALVLPGYGQLYASATATGRLAIKFFDLSLGLAHWHAALCAFAPDAIVAPPKVLRALAEKGGINPRHVFSGAEVLDAIDRQVVETAYKVPVREIYMATEGLFGVGCTHGVLHLAEDAVFFEWERPSAASELLTPIVTDFTRSTQVMARYRMNDLLRLQPTVCACGSPLQAVANVEGRQDDIFHLSGGGAWELITVTPDVVRNAVIDADRRILDFRVVQTAAAAIELFLSADLPADVGAAAVASLQKALSKAGTGPVEIVLHAGLAVPLDKKLRRVRRDWQLPDRSPVKAES